MRRLGKFLSDPLELSVSWLESLTLLPGINSERGKFDLSGYLTSYSGVRA